jgi:hypothetical protein
MVTHHISQEKRKMKHGISKNEMPTSMGVSFFKMPHGILCSIRILPNTLRKILEVFTLLHFKLRVQFNVHGPYIRL